jgi:hypothetical protein
MNKNWIRDAADQGERAQCRKVLMSVSSPGQTGEGKQDQGSALDPSRADPLGPTDGYDIAISFLIDNDVVATLKG